MYVSEECARPLVELIVNKALREGGGGCGGGGGVQTQCSGFLTFDVYVF